ncbi:MAG: RNase P subunit p30 family protein [Candidatus Hydrothermarchaeales archaeon]
MKFIDLHVHSIFSSGVDTPSRLLHFAQQLGIDIGLCDGVGGYDTIGVELHPKNKRDLKRLLAKYREKVDYIIVHGGDEKINSAAVRDERIDILAHPNLGRRGNGINRALAREAEMNNVAIEANLEEVIGSRKVDRLNIIRNIKTNLMLSRKYDFDLVVASGAKCRYGLRSTRQVLELLKLLGFDEAEAEDATYRVPMKILAENKERKDKNYVMKGVKVVG